MLVDMFPLCRGWGLSIGALSFIPSRICRVHTPIGRMVAIMGLWLVMTLSLPAQEFRAAWADVFHVGLTSQADVNTMVSTLVSGNYNAVVVQVEGYMDNSSASHGAHWKSAILPWSSRVTAGFDPLAYLCQQAHASGIEVHAWLGGSAASMYRVSNTWPPTGNTTLANHPEWFISPLANSEAGGNPVIIDGVFALDMGSPDVQEYIVSIVKELVTNYPIDGINWDDEMNGTGYTAGFGYPTRSQAEYARSGLARYRINTGATGTPSNTDGTWSNYRRRYKNELIARVQAEIQSIKTNPRQPLRHSLSPIAYSPVPSTCSFVGAASYTYFTDWPTMMQNGWVDAMIPQFYSSSTFNSWADRSVNCWQYNRHVFPGIGAYLNTDSTIANEINYTRSIGLKGNCIYSYAVPTSASGSGSGWWAYAAANVYTNTTTTPTMPWRNPATATEGIVWGRVKDLSANVYVDDATVTVTGGPTVKTDGNGYYIATLVPAVAAGTAHSTTASKSGMVSQTTNAIALAGDIVRYDFFLNVGVPTVPTGLIATAVSVSQINLSWTDTSTNETSFILGRSTVSGGPYTTIATLPANTIGLTNTGLAASTTYYYVVRASNAVGTSPNSAQASAKTLTNSAPVITIQPQSQSVVVTNSVTFSVAATGTAPLSYQWRFNGTPIPNATLTNYTIVSAQFSNGGNYSVTVTNNFGSVLSSNATLTVLTGLPTIRLTNIWNIRAGSRTYVTSNSTERGICINPFTGHVLLVSRSAQIAGSLGVFVLDANTGVQTGTMSLTGVNNTATFILNKIDVADDGVIYGANLTTASGTSPFIIYRWANEGANATVAYSGAPDGGVTVRWGDSFTVTGAGTDTHILISGSSATNTVLFTTTDGANFLATKINPTPSAGVEFSRGLFLVGGDNVYVKNRGTTTGKIYGYNGAANSASVADTVEPLDSNMLAIAVATSFNLLAGVIDDNSVNNSGHSLKVYDISSTSSPLLVSNFNFLPLISGFSSNNANFAGCVDTDNARIVGLDTQNGVVALQIMVSNPPPRINALTLLPANHRQFELNADPGNFVIQATSDFTNWLDLFVTRTNGFFDIVDPVTNSPMRFYRTKN
ncbi:MAG: hypothetical protein JWM68_5659 [Verrucomicrobiales bacterium]|nr:hypothetical protein [Verrucomicrobiales bacterium]